MVRSAIDAYAAKQRAQDEFGVAVASVLRSGVSQSDLARRLGVSQPYISGVASRYADSAYVGSGLMTLSDLSRELREDILLHRSLSDRLRLVAQTMTDFRSLKLRSDQEMFLARPSSTGDPRWDAMIAAVAAHETRRAQILTPEWTRDAAFVLSPFWFVTDTPSLRAYAMQHAAPEFQLRNVYVPIDSLESV